MHHSIPAHHAQHDLDLIAGHAAGDLSESDLSRADLLLASCTVCADLRRDLVAIAAATRSLPAPIAPRDYRLTEAQAADLRRGGLITSLLRPFAAPRSAVRPVAMAFTSLGLAGLLVANILPALLGGFGSAGAALAPQAGPGGLTAEEAATAAPAAPAASAGSAPMTVSGGPKATDERGNVNFGPAGQPTGAVGQVAGGAKSTFAANPRQNAGGDAHGATEQPYDANRLTVRDEILVAAEMDPMFLGSLVLLAVGLVLFGLRFLARRAR
jgi:hypothetical protein